MTELSGLVAILSDDGQTVIETKDLGPDPVGVKPGRVLPLADVEPTIPAGYARGEPIYTIEADKVTRTWEVTKLPFPLLTKRQIKRALIDLNITTDPDTFIRSIIAAIPDAKQKALALTDWDDAPYYVRENPLFNDPGLLAFAKMTPQIVDAIWANAENQPK